MANIDREERKKSLFEKQAMMDKAQKAKAKAEKSQASLLNPKKRKVCAECCRSNPRYTFSVRRRARSIQFSMRFSMCSLR